ncbi:MAG: site-specific integrase [Janthinobacterium lividum]
MALTIAEADAVRGYALAEKSEATRRGYASDFRGFSRWCEARGVSPLPASPASVVAFLAGEAEAGAKASTLSRKLAALRYAHRLAGAVSPTDVEQVRAVCAAFGRSTGRRRTRRQPPQATASRTCSPTYRTA